MALLVSTITWNSVLAAGLGSVVFLMQRHSWLKCRPALSHMLWLLVLLKLVAPPVLGVPVFNGTAASQTAAEQPSPNSENILLDVTGQPRDLPFFDTASVVTPLTHVLIAVAAAGTVLASLLCVVRTRRVVRLVRLAEPAPHWLQEITTSLARETGIRRHVSIMTLDGFVSPFLWVGIRGPSIVVPTALINSMGRDNLRLVVRHELLHYARRDHWTNSFSMIVTALLWWNPVAWWGRRELRFAQEVCCDAAVLTEDRGGRRRYAETLLQTIDFVASEESHVPVPATAFGSCSTLKRRIEMIGRKDLSNGVPLTARLFVLPLGALLVATSPSIAHDDQVMDELSRVRGEIRELRETVDDLRSALRALTITSSDSDQERESQIVRLTRERLNAMAERADLSEDERQVLFRLAERVDLNARQFERLIARDDLSDTQMRVLRKVVRVDARDADGERNRRDRDIARLTRERLNAMAERADLSEDERQVLFRLAERVDLNARQFERLITRDDLSDTQMRVLRKVVRRDSREADREPDRRDREVARLTRERLNAMAERADLSEDERQVLFRLAERVDLNARQFERLITRDDLSDTQMRVLRKVVRDGRDGSRGE